MSGPRQQWSMGQGLHRKLQKQMRHIGRGLDGTIWAMPVRGW
jgi:hypothetical protein